MRVGVVGAGPAGLCAARHITAAGMSCTVFEQSDDLGGTWVYTDTVGKDKYGLPVQSSMYRDLRINLPKEIVKFSDFDHTNKIESYITGVEIVEYLNNFIDHFNLRKYIKLETHVKKVSFKDGLWEVLTLDLPNNKEEIYLFDAILVCSGLSETPSYPEISGMDDFVGKSLHTHDYKHSEPFRNENVLVIGAGPSGMDISNHIAEVAKKVILSHHSEHIQHCRFPENVIFKPDAKEIKHHSVVFEDDSEEDFDSILYGTGYKVTYPFMDSSCDISIDMKLVYPLYKNFINAMHPTMAILGHMGFSSQFPLFDLQTEFFVKTLLNDILPSKEVMLKEIDDFIQNKRESGIDKRKIFVTTTDDDIVYWKMLESMANIKALPNVYFNIHRKALNDVFNQFPDFRENIYEVIDDENFVVKTKSKLT